MTLQALTFTLVDPDGKTTALSVVSTEARYAIYQQMEKILLDEMPVMPIFFYTRPRLISPKVKHYSTTMIDNFPWRAR